ncbi:MAG TPA: GNAT family N-acetyltransferase [Pyrinomonadaceae bacterium]
MNHVIGQMQTSDWDQVRAIYLEGIRTGDATFETEAPSWERWDESHHPFGRLVLRDDATVLGWAALSPVSKREVYRGVAEVTVYVAESARGKGIGRALLETLINESERNGIWTLQASIFRRTPQAWNYIVAVAFAKSAAASASRSCTASGATRCSSNAGARRVHRLNCPRNSARDQPGFSTGGGSVSTLCCF